MLKFNLNTLSFTALTSALFMASSVGPSYGMENLAEGPFSVIKKSLSHEDYKNVKLVCKPWENKINRKVDYIKPYSGVTNANLIKLVEKRVNLKTIDLSDNQAITDDGIINALEVAKIKKITLIPNKKSDETEIERFLNKCSDKEIECFLNCLDYNLSEGFIKKHGQNIVAIDLKEEQNKLLEDIPFLDYLAIEIKNSEHENIVRQFLQKCSDKNKKCLLNVSNRYPNLNEEFIKNHAQNIVGVSLKKEQIKLLKYIPHLNCLTTEFKNLDVFADLIEFLNKNELRELDLNFSTLGEEGAPLLSKLLENNKNITKLSLLGAKLGNKGVQTLVASLEKENKIKNLGLESNEIDSEGMKSIATFLKKNKSLKELNLKHNKISDDVVADFSEALKQNFNLKKLNLSANHISEYGLKFLSEAFSLHKTLKFLAMSGNLFDEISAKSFANALKSNTSLEEMQLSRVSKETHEFHENQGNVVYNIPLECFFEALQDNATIKTLDLSQNGMRGMRTKEALAKMLRVNTSLETLSLHSCMLTLGGAVSLFEALNDNKKMNLKKLILSSNYIGMRAPHEKGIIFKNFTDLLEKNTTLKALDLGTINSIRDEHVPLLVDALNKNTALELVDLSETAITNKDAFSSMRKGLTVTF